MLSTMLPSSPYSFPWPETRSFSLSYSSIVQIGSAGQIRVVLVSFIVFLGWRIASKKVDELRRRKITNAPPIVQIPEDEIFRNPRAAFERALRINGPVIGVKRKGRLEYIVDDSLTHEVLTTNALFSFEDGTAGILNLRYFNKMFRSYFAEMDDLVRNVIISRMPLVIEQVGHAFMKQADNFMLSPRAPANTGDKTRSYDVDGLEYTKRSIAEAMALIILGPDLCDERILLAIDQTAHDMALVTGIYQNTSYWGRTFADSYRLVTWLRTVLVTLPRFYCVIGTRIWSKIMCERYSAEDAKENPELYKGCVLGYLARKHSNPEDGRVGIGAYLHITALVLGIIFASVHQTASIAVWVIFQLAVHPEYIPPIRDEMHSLINAPSLPRGVGDGATSDADGAPISYDALQRAVVLDSFIREVLRTKGDTLSTCRMTMGDVSIAGYTMPKGHLVLPLASLSHMSPAHHGPDAETFDGLRWVESGKGAATVGNAYFPFGLGRWACPGRVLAVSEMKMMIWSILVRATPGLEGNAFSVPDPLNVTATAPAGVLRFLASE